MLSKITGILDLLGFKIVKCLLFFFCIRFISNSDLGLCMEVNGNKQNTFVPNSQLNFY